MLFNSPPPYRYWTGSMTNDHIRTCFVYVGGVMPGRRAGSGNGKYNAESPKQGSKRFNCQVRRNTLPIWECYLSMAVAGEFSVRQGWSLQNRFCLRSFPCRFYWTKASLPLPLTVFRRASDVCMKTISSMALLSFGLSANLVRKWVFRSIVLHRMEWRGLDLFKE